MSSQIPGGQPVQVNRAGFGLRLGAFFIDGIVLNVVFFIVSLVVGGSAGGGMISAVSSPVMSFVSLVGAIAYYVYFEGTSGQTLGKRSRASAS